MMFSSIFCDFIVLTRKIFFRSTKDINHQDWFANFTSNINQIEKKLISVKFTYYDKLNLEMIKKKKILGVENIVLVDLAVFISETVMAN